MVMIVSDSEDGAVDVMRTVVILASLVGIAYCRGGVVVVMVWFEVWCGMGMW